MTSTTAEPTDLTGQPAKHNGALRGRRISWAELYRERPDLKPDNQNDTDQREVA
ncbi:hypothetical protein [Mesorhizobium sp. SP-1A]|uniref:hypothetical protein n=1 Tax=Mesorhizobium sp. SP-1A TaxID=3077840 RepID=UPI0028F7258B|nr:hypothetical protein [Mesorhizobium sp. SP-1A]